MCVCVCRDEERGILGYSVVEYDPFFTLIPRLFDGICSKNVQRKKMLGSISVSA